MNWTPDQLWFRVRYSLPYFIGGTAVIWVAAIAFASRWRGLQAAERVVVVWLAVSAVARWREATCSTTTFVQVMGPLALVWRHRHRSGARKLPARARQIFPRPPVDAAAIVVVSPCRPSPGPPTM